MTPLKDTFVNLCVKYRWWLLIIGIFTISFFIGVLLIAFSIVGFVNKSKQAERKNVLSSRFLQDSSSSKVQYSNKKPTPLYFKKCPVCQHELKLGDAQYTCKNGGSNYRALKR